MPARRTMRVMGVMGSYGVHVTEPGDIRLGLEPARASGMPSLVNGMTAPNIASSGTRNQLMCR